MRPHTVAAVIEPLPGHDLLAARAAMVLREVCRGLEHGITDVCLLGNSHGQHALDGVAPSPGRFRVYLE